MERRLVRAGLRTRKQIHGQIHLRCSHQSNAEEEGWGRRFLVWFDLVFFDVLRESRALIGVTTAQVIQGAIAHLLDHVYRSRAERDQIVSDLRARLQRAEQDREELRMVLRQKREAGAAQGEELGAVSRGISACGEALNAVEGLMASAVAEARSAAAIAAHVTKAAREGGGALGEVVPETPPRRRSQSGNASPLISVVDTKVTDESAPATATSGCVFFVEGCCAADVVSCRDQDGAVPDVS